SIPNSFENFCYAIESRDELPKPEALKIKWTEESNIRVQKKPNNSCQGALYAKTKSNDKVERHEKYNNVISGNAKRLSSANKPKYM
ncbi:hypothetical protein WH47_10547, partial [Habropoda laboriosa]